MSYAAVLESPSLGSTFISAERLLRKLRSSEEIAVVDVREARHFAQAHVALSSHLPLSFLEPAALRALPRKTVSVVVVDADGGALSWLARDKLVVLGFRNVQVLHGGIEAWQAAGHAVASGYNMLVKAFADQAHAKFATPTITAAQLQQRRAESRPTTVIDCRPVAEYRALTVAGAYNATGVELAHLDFDAPVAGQQADPDHLWVITCFSRTRGIVGATTLARLAGRRNVAFLEDGIMAAVLQGLPTAPGAAGEVPLPPLPQQKAAKLASEIAARFGLRVIGLAQFEALQAQRSQRSLYVFDVRHESVYARVHLPGALSAPGGQLVMTYDLQVAVRRPRIVLVDTEDLLRATVTAFWLTQLGDAEVFILRSESSQFNALPAPPEAPRRTAWIDPADLADRLAGNGVRLFDVGPSLAFEQGHIPGARFVLRTHWAGWFKSARPQGPLVFTSPDGINAAYAADEVGRLFGAETYALRGGTQAWRAAGLQIETAWTSNQQLSPFEDDWGSPMRVRSAREVPFRDYLAWERSLGASVAADATVAFRWIQPRA